MSRHIKITIGAVCVNAILCAIWARTPDAFIISNAMLMAAGVCEILRGDHHGE